MLVTDNGGPYRSKRLRRWLKAHGITHLRNIPRTPEHNAWVERGNGEHQREMMLGVWERPRTLGCIQAALARATHTLNHGRLLASRGWKTPKECLLGLPAAGGVISRAVFYKTACQAIARAVEGLEAARERRRPEREAILATLQSFGLITRTRGGVPIPAPNAN